MFTRVVRLPSAADVAKLAAEQLLALILDRQARQDRIDICLTGGNTANAMYDHLATLCVEAPIDASKIHFWWGDERFVPATDPERNSLQAVERLARTLPVSSFRIHMMAAQDGRKDSHESAEGYESELGDTRFDLVLLGIGEDGHCASIFPNHPSFEPTTRLAIGVENSPKPPEERITLTFQALNRTDQVWFLATGIGKASAVARALAGDDSLPASFAHGERATVWFLDDGAAAQLPPAFECEV
ncbi:6-phosphogluconolactonase [Tessaracoccus sp. OH4464_COT-324]|uniref:6-phosphogluconolactonase n=1 Tax=Tessaracoccus sp. OH4464_COT-324 TaxID=2491059 RepID=UPI000F641215|nr:6-phosphogluconolactonase [Tessaracoccus sp. OH4464_COT-324]RRD47707.1 6-phosphogluconolactonase [Tessaracoccus sp. OH4464_COT-324]